MKNPQKIKSSKRIRRKARVRAKIFGTVKKPRLSIFKSLKHTSVQLIDDEKGKTLIAVDDKKFKGNKTEKAFELGKLLAKKSLDPAKNGTGKKIKTCVFDKSGYKYHGRVKAVADGARAGGLRF